MRFVSIITAMAFVVALGAGIASAVSGPAPASAGSYQCRYYDPASGTIRTDTEYTRDGNSSGTRLRVYQPGYFNNRYGDPDLRRTPTATPTPSATPTGTPAPLPWCKNATVGD